MSFVRFLRVGDRLVSRVSAALSESSPIVYESDLSNPNMQRVPLRAVQQIRFVATIPKPTTPKPSLEEFDPLNPGGWQLGAGGKILPRLPEGTRCGKLVMGKYGLYDPKLRRQVEEFSAGLDAGNQSESATPVHAKYAKVSYVLSGMAFVVALWNFAVLTYGEPIFPYAGYKAPGSA